ncbi:superoxide dismutase [Anaerotruncus massiliensis (ex Togo et al. 2019)]|uniref:superoxide dismutase n=1 Tax=Anaerotruncus massiliensis (ex Togo et al. 2019) TaxID=1673720 RepID=UPI0027B8D185|nr:superoxide dismutase [Anaerotruncus massiliensis (ex Togo et al. 2019)]
MNEQYPFELAPLPYAYDALEPYIDTRTVTVHHDRHQAGYVKKLNEALREFPEFHGWSLEQLILGCDRLPERIRTDVLRNAGGVWSHEFYFDCMTPKPASACPCGALAKAVDAAFGSCERLRDVMTQSALTRFGAGWAWLACDGDGRLRVLSTGNQDTPLPLGLRPVLCVDVWEHAYYLKYLNLRADYLEAWWKLVDWQFAGENYEACGCGKISVENT